MIVKEHLLLKFVVLIPLKDCVLLLRMDSCRTVLILFPAFVWKDGSNLNYLIYLYIIYKISLVEKSLHLGTDIKLFIMGQLFSIMWKPR